MHIQQSNKNGNTVSNFKLECIPKEIKPTIDEEAIFSAQYPTELGFMHLYIDGENITKSLPTTYVMFVLMQFAGSLPELYEGKTVNFEWHSDPFEYELTGYPERGALTIRFQKINKEYVFINDAQISLKQFNQAVVKASKKWLKWVEKWFSHEINHERFGWHYQQLSNFICVAETLSSE